MRGEARLHRASQHPYSLHSPCVAVLLILVMVVIPPVAISAPVGGVPIHHARSRPRTREEERAYEVRVHVLSCTAKLLAYTLITLSEFCSADNSQPMRRYMERTSWTPCALVARPLQFQPLRAWGRSNRLPVDQNFHPSVFAPPLWRHIIRQRHVFPV